jgi:hypothetical protein
VTYALFLITIAKRVYRNHPITGSAKSVAHVLGTSCNPSVRAGPGDFGGADGIRTHQLLTLIIALVACHKSDKPSFKLFASPDDAGNGLLAAAKSGDPNTILAVFGPDSKDIILSGDPVQDKNAADQFVTAYGVMHHWRRMPDESQILLIGADNFPFPIPLKKNAAGQWYFDAAAGREEILARHIGRNELAIIDVCGALADAQAEYFSQRHEGANRYLRPEG